MNTGDYLASLLETSRYCEAQLILDELDVNLLSPSELFSIFSKIKWCRFIRTFKFSRRISATCVWTGAEKTTWAESVLAAMYDE